jgi:hypothetical protein
LLGLATIWGLVASLASGVFFPFFSTVALSHCRSLPLSLLCFLVAVDRCVPGSGELDTATYLIRNGASLFLLDHYGDSPIHTAAARGHNVLLEWMYSYVEERLLRHCVEWQFVDFVRQLYKDMIKERVTEYEKQVNEAVYGTYH